MLVKSLNQKGCEVVNSQNDARAFWVQEPGKGELVAMQLPTPKTDEILVRTLFSAISLGTERLVFRGDVPVSQRLAMRAPFQDGHFPGPVKYGYSNVGKVEAGPRNLLGHIVFCLYPHQDRYVVSAKSAVPVPAEVPAARAVLAANMETAINGLWDAPPVIGSKVIVVGAGVVGCLMAYLAGRIPGVEVQLVDTNPEKRAVADALGVRFSGTNSVVGEADLVIHASGAPEGLNTALQFAGFEATVLEMSWFGARIVPLSLGESFHSKRITLRSSQVGAIGATQRPRWSKHRRLVLALELLADDALDCLLSGQSRFGDLPVTMERLAMEPSSELCHRIVYPGADADIFASKEGK